MKENIKNTLENYLNLTKNVEKKTKNSSDEIELLEKDGLVERLNKKYLVEDGRQLLND